MVEMEKMSDMACICEYFILKLNKGYSYTSVLNMITAVMKVEADIIASMTMRSVCMILVIIYVETFKTDVIVIVFMSNAIIGLTSP
jgi:hypothetical protein